eukprot:g2066.t1
MSVVPIDEVEKGKGKPDVTNTEGNTSHVSFNAKDYYVDILNMKPSERKELGVDTLCKGSSTWWSMCSACCFVTILIPVGCTLYAVTTTTAQTVATTGVIYFAIAGACFVLGCGVCCMNSSSLFCGDGAPCLLPKAPPLLGKLENAFEGEKTCYRAKVKHVCLIYNPRGGNGIAKKITDTIVLPAFEKANITVKLCKTQYAGHARDFARDEDLSEFDALCMCGGDGTFHEVVNGMTARPDGKIIPIGIIPCGTGNNFIADLGTHNCQVAVSRIISGDVCYVDGLKVDLGNGGKIMSVNCLSLGLIGDIACTAEEIRWAGEGRYDIAAVIGLLKKKSSMMNTTLSYVDKDGVSTTTKIDCLSCFLNNNQYFGKGLRAAPLARIDDGLMDLTCIKMASRERLLVGFQQIPIGSHVTSKAAAKYLINKQVKKCKFELEGKGIVNIDGEILKHSGVIEVEVLPKLLPIFTPPTFEEKTYQRLEKEKYADLPETNAVQDIVFNSKRKSVLKVGGVIRSTRMESSAQ